MKFSTNDEETVKASLVVDDDGDLQLLLNGIEILYITEDGIHLYTQLSDFDLLPLDDGRVVVN